MVRLFVSPRGQCGGPLSYFSSSNKKPNYYYVREEDFRNQIIEVEKYVRSSFAPFLCRPLQVDPFLCIADTCAGRCNTRVNSDTMIY